MQTKEPKYFLQKRDGMFFPAFLAAISSTQYIKKTIGRGLNIPSIVKGDMITFCYYWREIHGYSKWLFKKIKNNPQFKEDIIRKWLESRKIVDRIWSKIDKINLKDLSDKKLSELFAKSLEAFYISFSYPCISDSFSIHSEQMIIKKLTKLLKNKKEVKQISQFLTQLTEPTWLSFVQKEKNDLIKIMNKIIISKKLRDLFKEDEKYIFKKIKQYEEIFNNLKEHRENYFWVQNGYSMTLKLELNYFLTRIKEHIKINKNKEFTPIKKNKKEIIKRKNNLIQDLSLDKDFKIWIELIDLIGEMQDIRKARQMKAYYYFDLLLTEIGKRNNYDLKEMKYLVPEEIENMFQNKFVSHKKIQNRIKGVVANLREDGYDVYTGKKFEKFINQVEQDASKNVINNFSGLTACIGKVIGKVKIIMKSSEFSQFQEGEILVTSMTTPDFVPVMKRALAVVTDEGGLTCHAAIISRELDIPCIVGTKLATEVLKTGDLVEVNANHGVIKIINN